jgi:hypothetical protein
VTSTNGTPTGNATFIEGGTCATPTVTLAGPTLLDGSGHASFSTSTLSAGTHTITACYSGSRNFTPSNGGVGQTVNQAAPPNPAATSTTVTSSLNPSTYEQSVTFATTVTNSSGTPTGNVTFIEGGTCATPTLPWLDRPFSTAPVKPASAPLLCRRAPTRSQPATAATGLSTPATAA